MNAAEEGVCGRLGRIIWFSIRRFSADGNSRRAVALTYYTVFAIVPVAALLFGIAKGFDLDDRLRNELIQRLWQHQELVGWICKFADTTLKQARGGVVAGVGVIALIWTVLWLATNIEKAFNDVWGLPTRKNIFRRFSDYLSILLLTPVVLVVVGGAGVFLRGFFIRLGGSLPDLNSALPLLFSLCASLSPLLIACVIFTIIYRFAPNTRVRFSSALLAGVIAGVLFQLLQDGFLYLQGNIFRYNRIYGSFAALPLFLIWMQWSWQVTLFGAEIGFVAQNFDTGIFDRTGSSRENPRRRQAVQLAAGAIIYRNFAAGKGGTAWEELVARFNLPMARLESELIELTDAGIIFQIDGAGDRRIFTPARPTDKFTAAEAIDALESGNGEDAGPVPDPAAPFDALLAGFAADARSGSRNRLLAEL